jgi:hypothetical protein
MPVICIFSSYSSEMQINRLFISLVQHHAPEWSSIHTTKIFVSFFPFLHLQALQPQQEVQSLKHYLHTSTAPAPFSQNLKKEREKSIGCLCAPNFGKLFYDRLLFNIFLPFQVPFLCHIISLQSKA